MDKGILIFIFGFALSVIFGIFGFISGNNEANAYYLKLNQCVVENKQLPQPKEYCKSLLAVRAYLLYKE